MPQPISTSQKLWLGFGTLTALLLIVGAAIFLRVRSAGILVDDMTVARERIATVRELELQVAGYVLAIHEGLRRDEPKFRTQAIEHAGRLEALLARYQRLAVDADQQKFASDFTGIWRDLKTVGDTLLQSDRAESNQTTIDQLDSRLEAMRQLTSQRMKPEAEDAYDEHSRSVRTDVSTIAGFVGLLLASGLAVAIVMSVVVSRGIVKNEEVLAEQGERLRTTLASIGDAVITTDTKGLITSQNAVAETLTGWKNSEAVGQPLETVFKIVNEETRAVVESPATRALREGVIVGLANHTVLIARDGTERPIDDSAAPIRCSAGEIVGCVLVFRDVTERRRSDQALQQSEARKTAMFETALDGIITIDHHGMVLEFNASAEKIFGFRRDQVLGRELAELIVPPAFRERHRQGLVQYLQTGEGAVLGQRLELPAIRSDGTEFPVELTVTRIPMPGLPIFSAYVRDISDRQRADMAQAEQTRLMTLRAEVSAALASTGTMQEALQKTTEHLVEHLGVSFARIWTLNAAEDVLELQASAGLYTHLDGAHARVQVGQFKIGRIAKSRMPHLTNDVPNDPNISDAQWAQREGMVAFAGYPLLLGEHVAGVLGMFAQRPLSEIVLADLAPLAEAIAQFIERRQTERALRESELRYRLIGSAANDAIWDWNLVDNKVVWNEGVRTNFGYGIEEVGEDASWWVEQIHPEDRRRVVHDIHQVIDHSGESWAGEYRFQRSDGAFVHVFDRGRVVRDEEGKPIRMVGSMLDLTERNLAEQRLRESEEKFRLMADTIPQLAWMAHPDGNIFWYNQRWYSYTGTTPEEMEGWGWQRVHDPEILPQVLQRWKQSLDTGDPFDMVFPLRGADGEFRPFLTRVNALRADDGEIRFWFGTNTDITAQKETQEQLREIAAKLSEADRRKDEFLAVLAHELRNPLAPIRTGLEVMKRAKDDPATLEEIRVTMERQTQQLITLVDDLLDVSRITRGKLDLRKCQIKLHEVVGSAVEASKPFVDEAGHTLSVRLPEETVLLHADPHRLSQVLSNLLNNATKYTPEGGRIWLTAQREADEIVFSVKDNGIGIPPDMQQRIFEMFAQIERPMERGYTGLGIGLTLVKSLIEMHQGSIAVRSEGENRGSEFTVRIPTGEPQETKIVVEDRSDERLIPVGRRKVLVVDDNRAAAEMLSIVVKMLGSDVRTVNDGQQAVREAELFLPDVILMDLGMPRMNGYEAAQHIRQQSWGTTMMLVALTGWGQDEDKRRTREAGFDHHLVKPAEPSELERLFAEIDHRLRQRSIAASGPLAPERGDG